MAISVYEKLGQKITPKSSCSKSSNLNSYLMKLEYAADGSTVSIKNDPTNKLISPYLSGDKIQLHSRVTERKLIRKKTDFVSSFPLAVNIYKASSDEFKLCKQGNKKVKKSVLTLPNEPAPVPQMCTVSDMTESEYFNESKEERKPKTRKKRTLQNNRKLRKNKTVDIYDRDAHYCSQLDIDLDSSSTDFINRFPGDGKKQPRRKVKKTDVKPHDVWEMLRNINQFHFVPSAPISQDSIVSLKKKPNLIKTRNSCRDARVIETCRTEQFAYISNFVDNSHSQSSLDRVTVIDKQENYQKICKEIEKGVENCKSKFCRANQKKNKPKATRKQNFKAITNNVNNTEISKRHVNETPSSDIYNNINEQKNEKSGLKIYTTDNKEVDKFSNCIDSSQTNLIRRVDFNKQQEQEDNKLRKKIKPQMTGITKVVVSKGNNAFQKPDEEQNPDVITIATTPPILKPLEIEKPSSIVTEGSLPRSKQGKLNHGNLKVVYVGDIKINKGKANNNAAMHKSKANNKPNVLEKDVIEVDTEMKHKRQLKDKMIQLLYKKHQDDITDESKDKNAKKVERYLVETGTNTLVDFDSFKEPNVTKDVVEFAKPSPLKRSWAKGKWASDFIDSVIRKIRSGVYYSNEEKQPIKSKYSKREDSSQTSINHSNSMEPRFLNRDEDRLVPNHIPFKRPQPDVKSFNRTKIEKTGSVSNSVNELNLAVRERLKNVNFEDFDNTTQINFPKIGEHRNLLKQSDLAKTLPTAKHSWVDGKWASDFIDNIFKKIKSGVYYTHEEKSEYRTYQNTRDDLTQTESDTPQLNVSQCQETADENVITETTIETTSCESFTPLPGFDEPNELEIETYSQKQIVVKNCVTNVVVKFDVELPCDSYQSLQVKQSLSCIPVVTDTQTKVFKSKTTIINAYLPAELCSILPIIMRKIIVPNKFSLPKLTVGKVESSLSTISELTRCESLEFPNQTPCKICEPRTDLLLNMKSIKIFDCKAKSTALLELKVHEPDVGREDCPTLQKRIICMALQLYQPLNQIVPAYKRFNLLFYIENLIYNKVLTKIMNTPVIINSIDIRCFNNSMAISMGLGVGISRVNIFISNISNHSECNPKNCIESPQNIGVPDSKPIIVPKVLDIYTNKSESHATRKQKSKSELRSYNNKTKKRGFVKLYKKCKSMSNLSNYNSSISIDKITNFEEFFQTLGLPKMFSTVIDGNTERKIMSSLKEMKNWKADITSRQAFLVLLLANKKDTCNVLRYRPLILQGIAVNRITKASELDMEIEVIERENLNRLSQYEGISYLPASVENQDALLEELYWIAKTTASDYQRPFDESSERLLKSLLEKRKKLNPSYLRVMARYVGLGLLKTSK